MTEAPTPPVSEAARSNREAYFIALVEAIDSAGLSPGFGRVTLDEDRGFDITLSISQSNVDKFATAPSPTPASVVVPDDVARLVVAARVIAFGDADATARAELDAASEAFADRVPWTDEPARPSPAPVPVPATSEAAVPPGWKMVPIELTKAMISAWGRSNLGNDFTPDEIANMSDDDAEAEAAAMDWSAMLKASPEAQPTAAREAEPSQREEVARRVVDGWIATAVDIEIDVSDRTALIEAISAALATRKPLDERAQQQSGDTLWTTLINSKEVSDDLSVSSPEHLASSSLNSSSCSSGRGAPEAEDGGAEVARGYRLAVSNLKHIAEWLGREQLAGRASGYSFECLGEDMATIEAGLAALAQGQAK